MKTIFSVCLALLMGVTLPVSGDGIGSSSSYEAESLPSGIPQLVESERYDEAIAAIDKFILNESRNADAWNLLGYSHRKLGQNDQAMRAYKKALKLDRKHLGALEYQGELYLTLGNSKKAKKNLKKLEKYCDSCEQYEMLKTAIDEYVAGS